MKYTSKALLQFFNSRRQGNDVTDKPSREGLAAELSELLTATVVLEPDDIRSRLILDF